MKPSLLQPFFTHKYLLLQLTQKEVKARYKQSIVGYAWILLNPLAQLAIYTFVFSLIVRFPTNDIPYVVFLFSALLPWLFFQTTILSATNSLVSHADLLKKVAFPREIIVYSIIISKLLDFLFSSVIFFVFLLVFKISLHPFSWLFIPIFLVQILLMTGISLFLSAANLLYRDIQYVGNLLLLIWFYASPVVYPLSLVPAEYVWTYKLNPMVGLIEAYRSVLFGYPVEITILAWSFGIAALVFGFGFWFFKKVERVFADVV